MNDSQTIPTRLSEIIDDFALSEGREKLELLLEFSEKLPPLPDWLSKDHVRMDQIQEWLPVEFGHTNVPCIR